MKKHILSLDITLILAVAFLMASGIFALTSATVETRKITIQTFCATLGIISMVVIAFWDYQSISGKKNHIYLLCIVFLISVFIFGTGKEETGATSWIRLGHIGVQPSEFVKLLFALYLSCEISEKIEKNTLNKPKSLLIFILKSALIIGLVVMQNDTGTALVFIFMLGLTLFISGISKKYIFIAIAAFLVLIPLFWFFLADYQRDRILVFLNPQSDLSDAGYQVYLSKLAISSGGILGKGYKNGAVNALSYLPEKDTDFIFSIIGEESGLIGTLYFTSLFLFLIIKLFYITTHAKDLQGKILVTAICAMFIFHTIENVGMTIGLLPVTGIPLPFVSYGGSSMLSMSFGVGLALSVRRKTYNLLNS